jgi:GT2 family glycosyltransferase
MGAMMAEGSVLCFLNDDVEVGPEGIDRLYEVLEHDPTVGVVGPRGSLWKGAQHDRYVGETAPADAHNVSGFCFMVRTELFHRVGGFDISYTPAGFEEIDFCLAIRRLGYHCRVMPGLPITHHFRHGVSASAGTVEYLHKTIDTRSLYERNKSYFQRKWQTPD